MGLKLGIGFVVLVLIGFGTTNHASAQLSKYGEPGCEKCKPGEYRQRVTDIIPAGVEVHNIDDPPCGTQPSIPALVGQTVMTAAKTYAGAVDPNAIAGAVGNVSNALHIGGSVGDILGKAGKQYAACKAVCVIVPSGAQVTGTHYEIEQLYRPPHPGYMEVVDPTKPHFDFGHVFPPEAKPAAVCSIVSNWAGGYKRNFIMDAYFTSSTSPIEIR